MASPYSNFASSFGSFVSSISSPSASAYKPTTFSYPSLFGSFVSSISTANQSANYAAAAANNASTYQHVIAANVSGLSKQIAEMMSGISKQQETISKTLSTKLSDFAVTLNKGIETALINASTMGIASGKNAMLATTDLTKLLERTSVKLDANSQKMLDTITKDALIKIVNNNTAVTDKLAATTTKYLETLATVDTAKLAKTSGIPEDTLIKQRENVRAMLVDIGSNAIDAIKSTATIQLSTLGNAGATVKQVSADGKTLVIDTITQEVSKIPSGGLAYKVSTIKETRPELYQKLLAAGEIDNKTTYVAARGNVFSEYLKDLAENPTRSKITPTFEPTMLTIKTTTDVPLPKEPVKSMMPETTPVSMMPKTPQEPTGKFQVIMTDPKGKQDTKDFKTKSETQKYFDELVNKQPENTIKAIQLFNRVETRGYAQLRARDKYGNYVTDLVIDRTTDDPEQLRKDVQSDIDSFTKEQQAQGNTIEFISKPGYMQTGRWYVATELIDSRAGTKTPTELPTGTAIVQVSTESLGYAPGGKIKTTLTPTQVKEYEAKGYKIESGKLVEPRQPIAPIAQADQVKLKNNAIEINNTLDMFNKAGINIPMRVEITSDGQMKTVLIAQKIPDVKTADVSDIQRAGIIIGDWIKTERQQLEDAKLTDKKYVDKPEDFATQIKNTFVNTLTSLATPIKVTLPTSIEANADWNKLLEAKTYKDLTNFAGTVSLKQTGAGVSSPLIASGVEQLSVAGAIVNALTGGTPLGQERVDTVSALGRQRIDETTQTLAAYGYASNEMQQLADKTGISRPGLVNFALKNMTPEQAMLVVALNPGAIRDMERNPLTADATTFAFGTDTIKYAQDASQPKTNADLRAQAKVGDTISTELGFYGVKMLLGSDVLENPAANAVLLPILVLTGTSMKALGKGATIAGKVIKAGEEIKVVGTIEKAFSPTVIKNFAAYAKEATIVMPESLVPSTVGEALAKRGIETAKTYDLSIVTLPTWIKADEVIKAADMTNPSAAQKVLTKVARETPDIDTAAIEIVSWRGITQDGKVITDTTIKDLMANAAQVSGKPNTYVAKLQSAIENVLVPKVEARLAERPLIAATAIKPVEKADMIKAFTQRQQMYEQTAKNAIPTIQVPEGYAIKLETIGRVENKVPTSVSYKAGDIGKTVDGNIVTVIKTEPGIGFNTITVRKANTIEIATAETKMKTAIEALRAETPTYTKLEITPIETEFEEMVRPGETVPALEASWQKLQGVIDSQDKFVAKYAPGLTDVENEMVQTAFNRGRTTTIEGELIDEALTRVDSTGKAAEDFNKLLTRYRSVGSESILEKTRVVERMETPLTTRADILSAEIKPKTITETMPLTQVEFKTVLSNANINPEAAVRAINAVDPAKISVNTLENTPLGTLDKTRVFGANPKIVDVLKARRTEFVTQEMAKTDVGKQIVTQLERNADLTKGQLDMLWKAENKQIGIDLMEANGRSLFREVADDALKRGDIEELAKLKDEINAEVKACFIKGVC